jgi:hypothetical protein
MLHKDYYSKDSVEKKSPLVSLKGLGTKTKFSAVNRQSWSNFDFDFELGSVVEYVPDGKDVSGGQCYNPLPGNGYWRQKILRVLQLQWDCYNYS